MAWEIERDKKVSIDLGDILTLILVILIFVKVWGF